MEGINSDKAIIEFNQNRYVYLKPSIARLTLGIIKLAG